MRIAVMIVNMGGPDSLDAVGPYLYNIFKDPDIIDIPLPGFLRDKFVRWLSDKREPKSRAIFEKIGGKTPLNDITVDQAALLQSKLNQSDTITYKVFPAMRYWHPLMTDVWRQILSQKFKKLIVVSLYPFYSSTTTGSMEKLIKQLNRNNDFQDSDLHLVNRFGNHPLFIKAIVDKVNNDFSKDRSNKCKDILFSAHSIPERRISKGDPYKSEIEMAIKEIKSRLAPDLNIHLSYQSKIGPVKWLEPSTIKKIEELAIKNVKNLMVYPLGFVADNSETIYEIGMQYKELAQTKGITNFVRIDALNSDPQFIDMLEQIVLDEVKELRD